MEMEWQKWKGRRAMQGGRIDAASLWPVVSARRAACS